DRTLERGRIHHVDDVGDLHHVEQRCNARHHVLAHRGGGGDQRVVAVGQSHDGGCQRLGELRTKACVISDQHLAHASKLRCCLGDSTNILASNQNVNVAADLLGSRESLGRLVRQCRVVMFRDQENCHCLVLSFSLFLENASFVLQLVDQFGNRAELDACLAAGGLLGL